MFQAPPLAPLTIFDFWLLALIGIAMPIYSWIEHQRELKLQAKGRGRSLLFQYWQTILMLWVSTGLVIAAWVSSGRPLGHLGLTTSSNPWFLGPLGCAMAAGLAYGAQVLVIRRSPRARQQLRRRLAEQRGVSTVLPNSLGEVRTFRLVALTAGVTEEILFRGFLVWGLAHWMPVWAAAAGALLIFTLSHLYQETPRALAGVFVGGAIMTALALMSGSLIPAMLLHALVDLAGGEMAWIAQTTNDDAPAASAGDQCD